nr:MAG TPA: hypothetical protein [Caudoviricetes sp.]
MHIKISNKKPQYSQYWNFLKLLLTPYNIIAGCLLSYRKYYSR